MPDLTLPELFHDTLDEAGLRTLFDQLGTVAEVDSVRLKGGSARPSVGGARLSTALGSLLAGAVRGVQVRYRVEGESCFSTEVR